MELSEFAQDFLSSVNDSVDSTDKDFDEELAASLLEYLEDNGEVNAPEICSFKKTRARLTAYDYNDEAESLDLFYLIKADTLLGKISSARVHQGFRFLTSFYYDTIDGRIFKGVDICESDEIVEVAKLIESTKGKINQLRLYIITDGITDADASLPAEEKEDFTIEYNVWDMQRVYQQNSIRAGKEKVEIDFVTDHNASIQCLKMNEDNPYVDAYLSIIPGITLGRIYKQYQHVLLEKNVRTFLQFKGKVNKAIRNTLREQPDMFFSFNNGIATTASKIDIDESDGVAYITKIYDWQIVNGGQTTAAIAASLTDKSVDLTKVYVPMKVNVIKDRENGEEIIHNISTSANSQTAIKKSDFSANDPYLVDLENFSRQEWIPNGNNKPVSKWYFERTRGQYIDHLALLSDATSKKAFSREYPKSYKLTKTDIAKYESAWEQRPYDVCRGAEKNYDSFVARIKRDKPVINARYFHHIVAKAILFSTIDRCVKIRDLGGYKANMNAYIMSALSFLSNGQLDFDYIWEHQQVQPEIQDRINALISPIWKYLTQSAASGSQMQNVGERSKKTECWNSLKFRLGEMPRIDEFLLQKETNADGTYLNETQQGKIDEAAAIEPEYWFNLTAWAKTNGLLTPIERKEAFNYGTMRSRNKKITTLKSALNALKIIQKAQDLGFEG